MATFTPEELSYLRIDVRAIVECSGIAAIEPGRRDACSAWLSRQGYTITSIDCSLGIAHVINALNELLKWNKVGSPFHTAESSLDALNDGFDLHVPDKGGLVLELLQPEAIWEADEPWLLGMLALSQRHTRASLLLGRRYFVLLVLADESPLIGAVTEVFQIPAPFSDPNPNIHLFE